MLLKDLLKEMIQRHHDIKKAFDQSNAFKRSIKEMIMPILREVQLFIRAMLLKGYQNKEKIKQHL